MMKQRPAWEEHGSIKNAFPHFCGLMQSQSQSQELFGPKSRNWLNLFKFISASSATLAFTFYADDCAPPQRFDWINLWAITWSGNVLLLMTTGKHSVECILLLKVPEHAGSQRRHADFNSLTFQSTWLCGVCGLLPESRESKGSGRKGRAVVESGICSSHSFFSTVSILLERSGSSWLVLVSFCVSFLPKNLYQKPTTPPNFFNP